MSSIIPDHWSQICAVFEEALQYPASKRAAFLKWACPDDPSLRAEVEALLLAYEKVEGTHAFETPFHPNREPETEDDRSGEDRSLSDDGLGEPSCLV